jgi:hypothetical protein
MRYRYCHIITIDKGSFRRPRRRRHLLFQADTGDDQNNNNKVDNVTAVVSFHRIFGQTTTVKITNRHRRRRRRHRHRHRHQNCILNKQPPQQQQLLYIHRSMMI